MGVLAVSFLALAAAQAALAAESCLTCHANVKTEHLAGVHARDLGCTDCHGGDGTILGMKAHEAASYRGKLSRAGVPRLCAACHADVERMRHSGLPSDQYAQYRHSGHGRALAGGDLNAAVCTDCHGTHRILSHREPTSPVARRNVPATCGRCHDDAQLMEKYRLPPVGLERFGASVHGQALFADDHPSAPNCATCHGAHGALSEEGQGSICGQCHVRTREYLDQGPHGQAVAKGGMTECVSCHGHHDVAAPGRALFETACPSCHAPDSSALATAEKLNVLLAQAEVSLETATREIEEIAHIWPTLARKRSRLNLARSYFVEALPVQHALALDRVEDLTRSARSISDDVRAVVHGARQEGGLRYLWLAIIWLYLLFVAALAYLDRRERGRAPERREIA
jgi:hypothetical protein